MAVQYMNGRSKATWMWVGKSLAPSLIHFSSPFLRWQSLGGTTNHDLCCCESHDRGIRGAALVSTLLTQRLSSAKAELASEVLCWFILPWIFFLFARQHTKPVSKETPSTCLENSVRYRRQHLYNGYLPQALWLFLSIKLRSGRL